MSKKITCKYCGADYMDMEPKCPYCGTMNYKGAEAEYLNKLEDVRENLEDLGSVPEQETRKEIRKHMSKAKKVIIILIVLAVIAAVYTFVVNYEEPGDPQKEYLWKMENIPVFNELYEQGEYEELVAQFAAMDDDISIYDWEHYDFTWLMWNYYTVREILDMEAAGEELKERHYRNLLYYGWKMKGVPIYDDLDEDEAERFEPYRMECVEDLETRWDFTEKEYAQMEEEWIEDSGHVSFDTCEKMVKKWMKRRK